MEFINYGANILQTAQFITEKTDQYTSTYFSII